MSGRKLQSIEVPNSPDILGEGKPRRTAFSSDKLVERVPSGVTTLFDNFKKGVEISGDKPCFGRRIIKDKVAGPFVWQTYKEVYQRTLNIGAGLVHRGLARESMLGIFSINRPEWVITEQACNGYGYITVPLYDTLGAEAIEFIINETRMSLIVASNDKLDLILKDKAKYPTVKTIVLLDGCSDQEKEKATQAEVEVLSFEAFEEEGRSHPSDTNPFEETHLVTIMYTSGTTGLPKGVMLSNKNFLSDVASVDYMGSRGHCVHITKDDVHLSYLPLAHVFERMVMTYCLGVGAAIGFYQGSATKLLDDIDQLKPTIFPSVPRLLNRIYDKIMAAVELKGGLSALLFNMAYESKKQSLKNGYITHWLWDRLVFSSVQARLGGRVKAMVTGSAPISPEVMDFLRVAFVCEVYEAYGQTESCGGTTMTITGDYDSGHVGTPFPCNEIKLVDVPEMNYTSKDQPYPRGEICYRGHNIFLGYFNNKEKTDEALDKNGWLHSGDIGMWDEKGRLKIIDRKKNIFKLAQGEYIAPEKIENIYQKSKYVAQAFVYGDSLKAFLVAVIVPDEEIVIPYAQANGISGSNFVEYLQDPKLKEVILQDMVKVGKDLGLKSFEQVKEVYLTNDTFTVDNNLLTPTFKLKRPQAKEYFAGQINRMIEAVQKIEEEKERKQYLAEEKKN
jgi:long-chain acyl-CoA synthetase